LKQLLQSGVTLLGLQPNPLERLGNQMTHKFSFQHFTATLAALSATGLIGCASNEPAQSPVQAQEVPAAAPAEGSADSTAPAPAAADTTAAAPADKPTEPVPAPAAEASKPAEPAAAEAKPAPAAETKKPNPKHKAGGAKGGCGAGTCS